MSLLPSQETHERAMLGRDWGEGLWANEVDYRLWKADAGSGHPYYRLMIRSPTLGSWQGYVGVPQGHWFYGATLEGTLINQFQVHGGVTWAGGREGDPFGLNWWIGFDCAHAGDLVPALRASEGEGATTDTYRDFLYVATQVTSLEKQLVTLDKKFKAEHALALQVEHARMVQLTSETSLFLNGRRMSPRPNGLAGAHRSKK